MADARYPIGKFSFEGPLSDDRRIEFLEDIEQAPGRLKAAVKGLSAQQLETPYRDGGWTVRQVVHHLPESHMNAYMRLKLALTENEPTVKPYDEAAWANTADVQTTPIEVSMTLLDSLHARWDNIWRSM